MYHYLNSCYTYNCLLSISPFVSIRWKQWMIRTMDNRTSSLIHIPRAKKTYRSTRNKNGWPNQGTEVLLIMWSPIFSQRQKHMLQLHQARLIWAKGSPAYLQGSLCVIKRPPCAQGLNTTAEVSRSEAQRHRKLLAIYWIGFLLRLRTVLGNLIWRQDSEYSPVPFNFMKVLYFRMYLWLRWRSLPKKQSLSKRE